MSPFFYIIVSLFFTNIILSVIFFTAWWTMGRERHTLIWAATFVVGAIQWLVNIFKPSDFTIYWMLACSLSVGTVVLGTWGHIARTGAQFSVKLLSASGLAAIALTFYFTVIDYHRGLSMSLYIFHTIFYLCVCSFVLLKYRERPLVAEIGAASIYVLFAIAQTAAAVTALMQGPEYNEYYYNLYRVINFISLPTGFVGMALFIVFVLASDMAEKMRIQAITDPLTGVLNRRGFYQNANRKMGELAKNRQYMCLIYWDIDKFKLINDTYGHATGDTVLVETVKIVEANIKSTDVMGRLGGEEFVILLARASKTDADIVAERLREAIAQSSINHGGNEPISVTASFGVASVKHNDDSIELAINTADAALYSAKQSGRNTVVNAEP